MWIYLVVIILVFAVMIAQGLSFGVAKKQAADDPYPALGWQEHKVEDLRRYVRNLRGGYHLSEAHAEMRAEYLKVAEKKLQQEEEKYKELLIEWDRVNFERMMNR